MRHESAAERVEAVMRWGDAEEARTGVNPLLPVPGESPEEHLDRIRPLQIPRGWTPTFAHSCIAMHFEAPQAPGASR